MKALAGIRDFPEHNLLSSDNNIEHGIMPNSYLPGNTLAKK
jgi:hypothetical protein